MDKELKALYKIDKKTLEIVQTISWEEYKQLKNKKNIGEVVTSFKLRSDNKRKYKSKSYKGYFYCRTIDYDAKEVEKFLHDRRSENFVPTKKKNSILVYKDGKEFKIFPSEIKASKFFNITKQSLNYHLSKYSCYEKDGYKAIKTDNDSMPFEEALKKYKNNKDFIKGIRYLDKFELYFDFENNISSIYILDESIQSNSTNCFIDKIHIEYILSDGWSIIRK